MNFKKLNNIIGWVVFAIALYTYTATMEPTVSLWDCGEYISTSNKLEVGHPPGAPLFNMTGRLFSAPVSTENVAWSINLMSALCSAFTILFLFWSITYLAKKMALAGGRTLNDGSIIAVIGSGVIGALAYTFSDSFWFSAVEGEVYAMSSFFTAAVVWATFKWEERADEPGADRWLVLIFFLIGLSIGVHLLNLLAIPAIGYVYYFRKFKKVTAAGFLIAGFISMGILGFVQAVLIPGIVGLPAFIERTSKNGMGMPFNIGLIFSFVLLIALIVLGLMWTHRKGKALLNTIINCFMVICIGYSCFFMIPIRSQANTPIDEGNPENTASFISYLNREQYGSWPILWGPYWNSDVNNDDYNGDGKFDNNDYMVDGNPIYMAGYAVKRDGNLVQGFKTEEEAKAYVAKKKLGGVEIVAEYFVADDRKGIDYRYKSDHMTFLPRMFSREDRHVHGYMAYSGYDPNNGNEPFQDRTRGGKMTVLPTFGNNLTFLFKYQLGWMYFRYFMWNFAGRQNDEQGTGPNPLNGNWISGVPFIDNEHVGNQNNLPESMSRNLAYNKFFMLPLILGLIGFFYQFIYGKKDWFVIILLFIFTGIMIIIYLNPKPYEPRERDYAYAGSFYAFAFWIGLGIWALYDAASRIKLKSLGIVAIASFGFALIIWGVDNASAGEFTFSYSLMYICLVGFAMMALMILINTQVKGQAKMVAIVACLLGAPVPYIMAEQGWADHDRSNRTTALDFARNFLETCEPNAIIFTHGDNDTFPLWYAQEVEDIRTDVRIVNLSLLGTDWYIDQMLRKAYKSDPVPFSAPEYMYRQGGLLDYVSLDASKNKDGIFLDLREAMDYVMNDANVQDQDGRKFMAIPSRTFSYKVNADSIRKYKVLPENELSKAVKEMRFTVPKGSLYKNDLMILDLIAHNDWKRPVYFAGGADSKTYLGLDPYFQSEGLAYRLIPIESQGDPNSFGRVNVEKMYHNIMDVYKWGGMDKEGVNIDFFVRHTMTNNYRLMFYTLAQELSSRGSIAESKEANAKANIKMIEDTLAKGFGNSAALQEQLTKLKSSLGTLAAEKAKNFKMCKEVVEKCFKVMPEKNVPYDRIIPSFVPILYAIGDLEGAHKIADKLVDDHYQNFVYYSSLHPRFAPNVMEEAELSFKVLAMMKRFASDKKDKDREDQYTKKFESMNSMLSAWAQRCKDEDEELLGAFMDPFPHLFPGQQPSRMPMMPGGK